MFGCEILMRLQGVVKFNEILIGFKLKQPTFIVLKINLLLSVEIFLLKSKSEIQIILETGISWLSEIVSCQDVTWILNITSHQPS